MKARPTYDDLNESSRFMLIGILVYPSEMWNKTSNSMGLTCIVKSGDKLKDCLTMTHAYYWFNLS